MRKTKAKKAKAEKYTWSECPDCSSDMLDEVGDLRAEGTAHAPVAGRRAVSTTFAKPRYYAHVRQLTGTPYVYHAYVRDRETGKVAMACTHHHVRHLGRVTTGDVRVVSGSEYAEACAQRMLRRVLRKAGGL